jgi:hypothetical protein
MAASRKRLVLNKALSFCRFANLIRHAEITDMRLSTLTVAAGALVASFASANALPPVRAGILQCQGGQNVGFVVGSVTSFQCVFQSEGHRPDLYIATVRRYGVDLGFTEQTRFSWAVNAPVRRVGRGELAGDYGGVGANASVGVGFGGNFLVGGPANAYALQPVSVQGQTGLNVAAGIADIDLQPYRPAAGGRYYHRRRHRG